MIWKRCITALAGERGRAGIHMVRWQVLAAAVCLLAGAGVFCGLCWGWFDTTISTQAQSLSVQTYALQVTVENLLPAEQEGATEQRTAVMPSLLLKDGTMADSLQPGGSAQYALAAGARYQVTLTASGTAEQGYAVLSLGAFACATDPIATAEGSNTMTFTLEAKEAATLAVSYQYGVPEQAENRIANGQRYDVTAAGLALAVETPAEDTDSGEGTTPDEGENATPPATTPDEGENAAPPATTPDEGEGTTPPATTPDEGEGTTPPEQGDTTQQNEGTEPESISSVNEQATVMQAEGEPLPEMSGDVAPLA